MKYPSIQSAQTIILHCERFGFNNVVISPGSRNAPLAIGFASNAAFNCYSIIDERSAGFFALGISQQSKTPTILVCTSGSALLNYYPAISEAFFSEIPLIIISADRPEYKINIGDGQTIFQQKVFEKNILDSVNLKQDVNHNSSEILKSNLQKILSSPSEKNILKQQQTIQSYNEKTIVSVFNKATLYSKPVHVNVPFEEPLYLFNEAPTVPLNLGPKTSPAKLQKLHFNDYLKKKYSKIMVLVGCSSPGILSTDIVTKISLCDNIIVLKETTSNLSHNSFFGKIDQLIAPIELQENRNELFEELKPDLLITIGGMIVSKKIKTMLREHRPESHIHVGMNNPNDTFYCDVIHCKNLPDAFFGEVLEKLNTLSSYKKRWKEIYSYRTAFHKKFISTIPFCDLKVFSILESKISSKYSIQVSNSSAIRYMQLFDQMPSSTVFCNRGTSGIDGSTSTAIGASVSLKSPTLLITGDLSFFYDSNGLWNDYIKNTFRIILINNSGGGIFKILPGYTDDLFHEKFIETRHSFSAKHLAKMHGFKYNKVSGSLGLKFALTSFFKASSRPKLLEINTNSSLSSKILKNYFINLKKS
ncbi:thiamine pyrophosphate-binding protein [Flavobacteriaceae bacterium]|jgi:2-succinyl-5-enolpyruvyl-6-hydroxy-3-cyclohexene-1-carboxylate synthase|nr:thiamine pyrophosphate-binding protein [Flavobacteriaceae bacterium]